MATVATGEEEEREGIEVDMAEGSSSKGSSSKSPSNEHSDENGNEGSKGSSSKSTSNEHSDENGNEGRRNRVNSKVRDQEKFLPIANISRIMKKALPGDAKIAKDAKHTMQACVSEFVNYVTHEAIDKCKREKRKTVNGDDLLWAMSLLGFEDSAKTLQIYLDKYREAEGGNKGSTMDKPGDANSENKEGASPPMSTVVQVGPGSVYGGGMPILPHMPQMMAPNGHQIDMPPPMTAPGSYQIGMPPPMIAPGSYQMGMLPPRMEPDNYQMQMQIQIGMLPPTMEPVNYQMQNQIGMLPPTMEPENYQMQNQIGMLPATMEPVNYQMQNQIGMPPPTMEPDRYHLQNQMMGAPGNQQL